MLWLCMLCAALGIAAVALSADLLLDRRALDDLRRDMGAKLEQDTNTLLTTAGGSPALRRLAADLNDQLRLLREQRQRYQTGNRELKEMVTNISHDLRTPLTAICGYLELLEREELPPRAREELSIIAERAGALKQLTGELLQYAVAGSPDAYKSRETVSLNREVEDCAAAFYAALKERGIAPEITLPQAPVLRRLSRAALSRILGNVMSNAVRYSDGDLRITLTDEGEICFANHAAALDDVTVGRLFDRFYTVENGRDGTGLGLSIARELTEAMGGTIEASLQKGVFSVRVQFFTPSSKQPA